MSRIPSPGTSSGDTSTVDGGSNGENPSVFAGVRWTSLAQGTIAVCQLVSSLVLFKLLPIEVFGIVAMAHVVTGFAEQLRELGTRMAVVQRKSITPQVLDSAFLINVTVGSLLGASVWIAASPAAVFYQSEDLRAPLQALAGLFVIASLGQVQRALLTRSMRFGKLAAIDVTAALAQAATTIWLAGLGYGVWAFVIGELVMESVAMLGLWIARPWWPGLQFRRHELRTLIGFGANLMGFNLANYFFSNADRLIIGRVLGADALGLYAFAQRLTLFPMRSLSGVLVNVIVPRLAREQGNLAAVAAHFARASAGIALLSFPLLAALAVLIGPLVMLYDPKWSAAVALVVVLAPGGMIQSVTRTVGPVLVARGRPDLLLRLGLIAGALAVIGSIIGVQFGVSGVAVAFVASTALTAIPTLMVALHQVSAGAAVLAKALEPVASATLVTLLGMTALAAFFDLFAHPAWLGLGAVGLLGATVYWGLIALRRPPALADLLRLLGLGPGAEFERSES